MYVTYMLIFHCYLEYELTNVRIKIYDQCHKLNFFEPSSLLGVKQTRNNNLNELLPVSKMGEYMALFGRNQLNIVQSPIMMRRKRMIHQRTNVLKYRMLDMFYQIFM